MSGEALAVGFLAAIALFVVVTWGLYGEPRRTPGQLGRWWAGWIGGGFMFVGASEVHRPLAEYLFRIALAVPPTMVIAFAVGAFWRKMRPLEIATKPIQTPPERLLSTPPQGLPETTGTRQATFEQAYEAAYPAKPEPLASTALASGTTLVQTERSVPYTDDDIYDLVGRELETGNTVRATWTRAYAEADGDERRARAIYIKLRVDRLRAAPPPKAPG